MASILHMSPYPWSRPEARQLHVELYKTYPNQQDALRLAGAADMNVFELFANRHRTCSGNRSWRRPPRWV